MGNRLKAGPNVIGTVVDLHAGLLAWAMDGRTIAISLCQSSATFRP